MATINKSAPWYTYFRELSALLGKDPDIKLKMEEAESADYIITVTCRTQKKADALRKIIVANKTFGNIKLRVDVLSPAEKTANIDQIMKDAFENNPVVNRVVTINNGGSIVPAGTYVEFVNGVVQFFDDRIDDLNGNTTTLYQIVANDVLVPNTGVRFCTAKSEETDKQPEKKPNIPVKTTNPVDFKKEIDKLFKELSKEL